MKRLTTVLIIAFLLCLVPIARASMASQVDLELALEKRISSLVNRYDPMAIVRVTVSFKRISAPLPGTDIELKNFSGGDGRGDEISSASVTIHTAKEPLPDWIKEEVVKLVPEVRASLNVKPLSEDARMSMTGDDSSKVVSAVQDFLKSYSALSSAFSLRLALALGFVALISLAVGTGVAFAILKKRTAEMNRIIEARLIPALQNIGSMTSENNGSSSKPTVVQATLTAPAGGFRGGGDGGGGSGTAQADVAHLSLKTLEALFNDCYWCQNDGYAAWLWGVMTPAQRQDLCASPNVDAGYFKAIQVSEPQKQNDHLDPAYLNPLKIDHLSQEDMGRWVESFLPGFHLLSPMRQGTLPVSLKTRLSCMAEPLDAKTKVPPLPERPSARRKLTAVQRLGELTFDDETTVLHNPAMVPETLRTQVRSLVWLALKPFEARQKALNEFSAEELASAWGASPEVLSRLNEALSEKKRSMLEGYLKSVEVNKKAYVFTRLVDAGLTGANETATPTERLKLAA